MPARSWPATGSAIAGKWYVAAGQTYMREPAETSPIAGQPTLGLSIYNQYRVMARYGNVAQRGLSGAVGVAVDDRLSYVQSATVQTNYNWDCCGVAFEYSRWAYAPTISKENSVSLLLQPGQHWDLRHHPAAAKTVLELGCGSQIQVIHWMREG